MRPVDKGIPPRIYTDYNQARHDLAGRIGYYCSYCEMKVYNSIEVEHILPQNQRGAVLDWGNFLLSCKYCNTIKSDHNTNITDYFWPDRDNSDLAFAYDEINVISPEPTLSPALQTKATATINLMGLNRYPGGIVEPTEADTRWRSRKEVWDLAKRSIIKWRNAPIPDMAEQIALVSIGGHYSIWMEVFRGEQAVLDAIDAEYRRKGLFKNYTNGIRDVRVGGLI